MKRLDLTGAKFGNWTVIADDLPLKVKCKCACGAIHEVWRCHLTHGRSTQCKRCYTTTHGQSRSATYKSWSCMIKRCGNPRHKSYPEYGGRGIQVVDEWKKFENFFADMGERPVGKTLDRIDVNGGYSKSNCRWADRIQQANNLRNNRLVEFNGSKYTCAELARVLGMNYFKLWSQIKRGTFNPSDAASLES